jgi:hypothetical protein
MAWHLLHELKAFSGLTSPSIVEATLVQVPQPGQHRQPRGPHQPLRVR